MIAKGDKSVIGGIGQHEKGEVMLPRGEYWIGVDKSGEIIAASITKERPSLSSAVFEGSAGIYRCRVSDGGSVFGKNISDVTIITGHRE